MTRQSKPRSKSVSSRSQFILMLAFYVFLAFFLVAFGRIFYLQTIEASELEKLAEQQRLRTRETPAPRGTIYDRNGEVLASSVQAYDIIADPTLITRPRQAAQMIAAVTGGDEDVYYKALRKDGKKRYSIVEKKVAADKIDKLKAAVKKLPREEKADFNFYAAMRTLSYQMNYRRSYPAGMTAAQVLGFVDQENVGKAGLELYYDEVLKGINGVSISESDVQGNPIPAGIQTVIDPQAGNNIVLTIDKDIQFIAESKTAEAVERHQAIAGSFIVMSPKTGEIYAAGSVPSFDPNAYNKADPDTIRNRAISDLYEPGSTLKPITIAGALQAGAVRFDEVFTVPTQMKVGTRTVRDSTPHATASWTTSQILELSSNVGTTLVANKLGKEGLYATLTEFKLDKKPQIDFPAAAKGQVPSPDKWVDVSLSNFSFGQGIAMSPLHLASSIACLANGGEMAQAHFLKDVPSNTELVPQYESMRVIDTASSNQVKDMMRKVMTEGTGKSIELKGYTVAGKTGTAQKAMPGHGYVKGKYMGSFVGYLPAEDPQLLVYLVIDEPKAGYYGSVVAGRAFTEIAAFSAKKLGITPNDSINAD